MHVMTVFVERQPMGAIGQVANRSDVSSAVSMNADERRAADRALREKNRYWNEKPATRFCLYFCVFVASEVLVGITLHWIFHII
jgi:hypothetical protein